MSDEKIIDFVLQAGKGLTGPVVRIGPGVLWKESVEDIYQSLKTTDTDLDGFVLLLRIAGMMYQVRGEIPSRENFLNLVGEVWDTIHPAGEVKDGDRS